MSQAPAVEFEQTLEDAFPSADPQHRPYGSLVLVQSRSPKMKTAGGILLPDETRYTIQWNTQVNKVIAVGPIAFKNRDTQELWPEGAWCEVGDFVRCGKYPLDRWEVKLPDGGFAIFGLVRDLDLLAEVTGDPLSVVAFV